MKLRVEYKISSNDYARNLLENRRTNYESERPFLTYYQTRNRCSAPKRIITCSIEL